MSPHIKVKPKIKRSENPTTKTTTTTATAYINCAYNLVLISLLYIFGISFLSRGHYIVPHSLFGNRAGIFNSLCSALIIIVFDNNLQHNQKKVFTTSYHFLLAWLCLQSSPAKLKSPDLNHMEKFTISNNNTTFTNCFHKPPKFCPFSRKYGPGNGCCHGNGRSLFIA